MKKITKIILLSASLAFFGFFFSVQTFAQVKPSIYLQPDFQQLGVDDEFLVGVLINSNDQLVGADAKINFDPQILEVTSIDDGDVFDRMALKSVSEGRIVITGLADEGEKFKGLGRLALIHFKAKDAGEAVLEVEFNVGSTTDSNLSSVEVKDTLSNVDTGKFVAGGMLERGAASARRGFLRILPLLIFLILLGAAAFLGYRWWKDQQGRPKNIFIPGEVPMDRPPPGAPPAEPTG